jgi:hypothetical protein
LKKRNTLRKWKKSTIDARGSTTNILNYFLEPIPENFGYSLGGYSHRERWARTRWYFHEYWSKIGERTIRKFYYSHRECPFYQFK